MLIASDVVYTGFDVPALAAAVIAHTRPGGAAHLMSAKSRFDEAGGALLDRLRGAGTVELEPMTVHNSHGRTELVLATWRKGVNE